MSESLKKTTLTIKDVCPISRHLFNEACSSIYKTRGEVISEMMREKANEVFGEGGAQAIADEYKKQLAEKSHKKTFDIDS